MATYFDPTTNQNMTMNDLLSSLDEALFTLKDTESAEQNLSETISLLHCIHEMSSDNHLDAISDLAYQVSTYLLEISRVNIPFDHRILSHLYVTRSLIHEAYEKLLRGGAPYSSARARALIGSFHRCISDMAVEHGKPSPFSSDRAYINA